jgi:osmoprotectant transport system permease protein
VLTLSLASQLAWGAEPIVIGSKIFTESYILAEIAAQIVEAHSQTPVKRRFGMGSTGLLFESLKGGAIDVYPDYTGTLAETILKRPELKSIDDIREALSPLGLTISDSLGFNNTYALAVTEAFAEKYHLGTISDLARISATIRAAFSYEFMDRQDGYLGMVDRYQIKFSAANVKRMEHSLVYKAIDESAVDLIEVYSTDANIRRYQLRLLKDDRQYFPNYQAVWVARKAFVAAHPGEWQSLSTYRNALDESTMASLNAEADVQKTGFEKIAAQFLGAKSSATRTRFAQILERTHEHLWFVGVSLLFSVLIGVPLGVIAARFHKAGQLILLLSALIQTIPALALLCFLIPAFGVGTKPALVALCLYSLLPVVLNTFTGLRAIDAKHIENAKAFGLSPAQILRRIVLPLASPTILAGIKTGTIVSIGTATLAALVGAGGYGALIVSGLSLNDIPMILMGAVPAAAMALFAHIGFAIIETLVISKGLR